MNLAKITLKYTCNIYYYTLGLFLLRLTLLFRFNLAFCNCAANELTSPPSLLWDLDMFIGGGGGGGGACPPAGGIGGPAGGGGGAGGALTVLWWPLGADGGDIGLGAGAAFIGIAGAAGTLFCGVMGDVCCGDINEFDIRLSWIMATSSLVMVRYPISSSYCCCGSCCCCCCGGWGAIGGAYWGAGCRTILLST